MKKSGVVMLGTRFDTKGGISAVVNVYRASGLFDRWGVLYIETHRDGKLLQKLLVMLWAWLRFLTLIVSGRMSALHVHVSFRGSFWRKCLFLWPAYFLGKPVLLHLHSGGFASFYEDECGVTQKWFVRQTFRRAKYVVVLSESWEKWVRSISEDSATRVILNPVSLTDKVLSRDHPRRAGRLVYLGRINERKGTFDLLKALAIARAKGSDVTLAIGGDGDRVGVEATLLSLGIRTQVELLGWVRGDEKRRLLDHASVFVLPSYHEGLPMGILEAMAAGLPIISTPVGGIPEAVTDGVEGFLVEPGDIETLAARLAQLADDPELAARMGAAARDKVARCFAAEVIVPQVEALYDEMLA